MKKLKTFALYFAGVSLSAFALYMCVGGVIIVTFGGWSLSKCVAGAIGFGLGTGLANGAFYAWKS